MTSAIPVRCSTNWAMKPHIGSKVNLLSSFLPVQWNHVKYIWNNSYLYETKVKSDHRSKFSNLSNWKVEAWKKSGLQRDSNPWPPRYRCDALPTELWSHTLGARSIYWVHFFPCSEIMWNIYEIIHIWTIVLPNICQAKGPIKNGKRDLRFKWNIYEIIHIWTIVLPNICQAKGPIKNGKRDLRFKLSCRRWHADM